MNHRFHSVSTIAALAALSLPLAAQKSGGFGGGMGSGGSSISGGIKSAPAKAIARLLGSNGKDRAARGEARAFRQLKVPGQQVAANVAKLTKELRWYGTLSGALAAGRNAGKPVVFIQALGDLDGFL